MILKQSEKAVIKSLKDSPFSTKLLEMGFLPGREIKLVRKAPGGSPIYLDLNGQYFALRKEEADSILLEGEAR